MDSNLGTVRIANIETEMRTSYLDYSMSVIVQRALPDARDGLKPVQRRILYAMHEMGLRNNTRYRKCAGIIGEVLKNYHPHSDQSVYDALVRLAQDFNVRYPLIDPQGNFGSVDGDRAAAMRYTEARLAAISDELLADIDKNTVDYQPNYDASTKEPKVLPGLLPNLLLNGASGIAVGMATNIPPHNLRELADAITHLIDNPEASIEDLTEFVQGPDFPTGGTILGTEGIRAAYATGRGRIVIRATATIEESARSGRQAIVVTELPYQVNKAALLERIAEMVKEGRLEGIADLRDESDRTGMRMIVEVKRDSRAATVLNNLFKHTALQQAFGVNMLALVENGQVPRVLTLKRALQEYIAHRQIVIVRRTEFDLDRARRRVHILEGLKKALDIIDQVIATIRRSRTTESARNNLIGDFKFSELQANAILDMRLARLAALERKKIEDELTEVLKTIAYLESLLADRTKILGLIKDDMARLKATYGDDRKTRIQPVFGEISDEDLISRVDVLVTITNKGYVKRIPADVYRTQHRGGRGVTGVTMREADGVQLILAANTHDSLMLFTNRGRVYVVKVYDLPDSGRTAKGLPIINIIDLMPDESVTTMLAVKDFATDQYLFFTTRLGQVKRTPLVQFKAVRKGGMIAIGIEPGDELAWVRVTSGADEISLVTQKGQAIRFREEDARSMGRAAAGVRGIRLAEGDRVIASQVVQPDGDLVVVAQKGLGKRTPFSQFGRINRGGKGVTAMRLTDKTGDIVGAGVVTGDESLMMISTSGQVIKIPVSQISKIGRATSGVTLMRMSGKELIASIAINTASDEVDPIDELTAEASVNGVLPEVISDAPVSNGLPKPEDS